MNSSARILTVLAFFTALFLGFDCGPVRDDETLEARWLTGGAYAPLAPFFSSGNSIYGGYYGGFYTPNYNYGSWSFYSSVLPSYKTWATAGIYGYAAGFPTGSGYTFFKGHTVNSRSIEFSGHFQRRQNLQVQCKNEKGEPQIFSRAECDAAASKMSSEQTAVSTCGTCMLVTVGPQGQPSSSTMPAAEIQHEVHNILDGCSSGPRFDPGSGSTLKLTSSSTPSYVILLTKGNSTTCL